MFKRHKRVKPRTKNITLLQNLIISTDIRKTELVKGRSINLALSSRGRAALRGVGLEGHMVREYGIPMAGRMIHKLDGTLQSLPYDPRTNKVSKTIMLMPQGF